ncbi:hypothetical protein WJ0W_002699 [Paenibacillus melissococcoides]|uniref:Uncharacterized protein n=1 Tax=Paenibacillus melissococcoides TaxID=2912268 RepID=A0ABN8U314_9BACL|nr:hypothetical protein WJ0W_002699 [Paenibacillus melissococcoides]
MLPARFGRSENIRWIYEAGSGYIGIRIVPIRREAAEARIDVKKARALLEHFVKEKADAQSLKELIYGKPL